MGRWRTVALAAAAAHLLVMATHAVAHMALGVMPATVVDYAYITLVIYAAPLAAVVLLRRGRLRPGAWLLLAGAVGSLAYGTYHHYLVVSPDHVDHLPAGAWAPVFRATAALTFPVDVLACFAVLLLLSARGGRKEGTS